MSVLRLITCKSEQEGIEAEMAINVTEISEIIPLGEKKTKIIMRSGNSYLSTDSVAKLVEVLN